MPLLRAARGHHAFRRPAPALRPPGGAQSPFRRKEQPAGQDGKAEGAGGGRGPAACAHNGGTPQQRSQQPADEIKSQAAAADASGPHPCNAAAAVAHRAPPLHAGLLLHATACRRTAILLRCRCPMLRRRRYTICHLSRLRGSKRALCCLPTLGIPTLLHPTTAAPLAPAPLTLGQAGLAASGHAQHGVAAGAHHHGLAVAEHSRAAGRARGQGAGAGGGSSARAAARSGVRHMRREAGRMAGRLLCWRQCPHAQKRRPATCTRRTRHAMRWRPAAAAPATRHAVRRRRQTGKLRLPRPLPVTPAHMVKQPWHFTSMK